MRVADTPWGMTGGEIAHALNGQKGHSGIE